jgi:hypothetical protein
VMIDAMFSFPAWCKSSPVKATTGPVESSFIW